MKLNCPDCGYQNPEDAIRCKECGLSFYEIVKKCPHCGADNQPKAIECNVCGNDIFELESQLDESTIMKQYGITFDGEKYHYREYRYQRLQDAVNYAKLQELESRQEIVKETKICPSCLAQNELGNIYCIKCGKQPEGPGQWLQRLKEPENSLEKGSTSMAQSQGVAQKGFRQVPDAFDVGYVTETGLVWDKYSIVWILITAVIGFASISAISEQNFEGFLVGLVITVISGLYARYLIQGGRFRIIFF